jgi:hypothetical protein
VAASTIGRITATSPETMGLTLMEVQRDGAANRIAIAASRFGWKTAAKHLGIVLAAIACAVSLSACGGSFVPNANAGPSPHGGYFGGS